MIRLKDIALRSGVSVMTVSKVLRDAPDISAATKGRVTLIAQQMGYVPDSTAQSLRNRTTRFLGVVIPSVTDPTYTRVVLAIEERAYELGYEIILAHTLNSEEREAACIQRLLSRRVDGIFISPVYRRNPEAPVYQNLSANGTPVVVLGPQANFCSQFVNVQTDEQVASRTMTEYLLQLGHRQIAFFGGPQVMPWCRERLEGYKQAFRDANVEYDDRLIFEAGYSIEDGTKAALQFVNEETKATAIQAVNDLVAIGAANIFLSQGRKIPEELSIAGFGNILTSEHYRVPLTTIRQPKHRLGIAAMESMMKLLNHEKPEPKQLRAELIARQSTAAPKA